MASGERLKAGKKKWGARRYQTAMACCDSQQKADKVEGEETKVKGGEEVGAAIKLTASKVHIYHVSHFLVK